MITINPMTDKEICTDDDAVAGDNAGDPRGRLHDN
jgi:hypothetical protein